jgi:hypothetical protein
MISFSARIEQFGRQGEKTGWTFVAIPQKIAEKLLPAQKRSFRVKGTIDGARISQVALLPMGGGDFILPLNAALRKMIRKRKGAVIDLKLEVDQSEFIISPALMECLQDEPEAKAYFEQLAASHQKYYSKWIESAKTETTKTKRIAQAINAFVLKLSYGEMIRMQKDQH